MNNQLYNLKIFFLFRFYGDGFKHWRYSQEQEDFKFKLPKV